MKLPLRSFAAFVLVLISSRSLEAQILYVVTNGEVDKITMGGVVTTFAAASGLISAPYGLAVNSNGDLFVANSNSNTISRITPAGAVSTYASASGFLPTGLAFNASDTLYVTRGNVISRVNSLSNGTVGGVPSLFSNSGLLNFPIGIAVDASGNLFVANAAGLNRDIVKITPGGVASIFVSHNSIPTGSNLQPFQLAFNSTGDLFVADMGLSTNDGAIYRITPAGVVSTFVSGLNEPIGLAFDSSDNLFVSTYAGGTILEIDPSANITTFVSGLTGHSFFLAYSAIPEPATYATLAGLGALGLALVRRWRAA